VALAADPTIRGSAARRRGARRVVRL